MIDINNLVRENIRNLTPYSSARDEFKGTEGVFLDANEIPFNGPYNRYPDPLQRDIKVKLAAIKGVKPDQLFLGNGSDEAIDLLYRAFCEPYKDNVVSIHPSYGMYQVAAGINAVEFIKVPLKPDYALDTRAIRNAVTDRTRMIMICSPNNPTANSFDEQQMIGLLEGFNGLLVVDEAYIDFSVNKGLVKYISQYPNLVILQTFSKAWGLAGLRMGVAIASEAVISVLNKIKYPYNVNVMTQHLVLDALNNAASKDKWVEEIIALRIIMTERISALSIVKKVYPSDANFILVEVSDAKNIYDYLVDHKVIVRDRSKVLQCDECLRITIGSANENDILIETLIAYTKKYS